MRLTGLHGVGNENDDNTHHRTDYRRKRKHGGTYPRCDVS
jgi:hypothetical protein